VIGNLKANMHKWEKHKLIEHYLKHPSGACKECWSLALQSTQKPISIEEYEIQSLMTETISFITSNTAKIMARLLGKRSSSASPSPPLPSASSISFLSSTLSFDEREEHEDDEEEEDDDLVTFGFTLLLS
jgi:hypothetical protein